jgi:obg-like ATPase 1
LDKNVWVRKGEWKSSEIEVLNTHRFITAKSVVYLVNLSEEDFINKKNKWLKKIKEYIDNTMPGEIIPYSADYERKTLLSNEEGQKSMLPKIVRSGYNALDLIYFFTSGKDEVRCWTIRKQTKAPRAAGAIHTDFEKGFICAEIMRYEDFIALGSEQAVKAEGKYVQKGKEYIVEDADIILFRFNVSGKK